jgi:hypothetical protein
VRQILHRVGRQLEEQWPVDQRCLGDASPELFRLLADRQVGLRERCEEVALLLFDRTDHLGEQALAGAEVVDQHPVAGSDRGRDTSQARVADPVLRKVLDGVAEQGLTTHPCPRLA